METGRRSFERVYDDCYSAVLRYCLRRTNREDALDATAETFLVAWRRVDALPVGRELPWLYGVAFRVLANQRRASARRAAALTHIHGAPAATGDGEPELLVLQGQETADLVEALGRLSPSDQELIRLAGWEELDRDALALAVGCTANAATKRLNRALDRLGRELGVSDRVRGRFFRRKREAS